MPTSKAQQRANAKAILTKRGGRPKGSRDSYPRPVHPSPAERAHEDYLKTRWSLEKRRRWWLMYAPNGGAPREPFPPHPRDKVAEKDLPQAMLQAVEAMHEFGVMVEASRASGIGRFQLEWLIRKHPDGENIFREDMRRARRECQERLEGAFIARGMLKGGELAGIFYLKHNRGKYREVQRLELTGKDGSPLQAFDAAKAELLTRLSKLAGLASEGSAGSREGVDGKQEIVLEAQADMTRPRLVKSTGPRKVKKA